jgi:hypothetical protein
MINSVNGPLELRVRLFGDTIVPIGGAISAPEDRRIRQPEISRIEPSLRGLSQSAFLKRARTTCAS